MPTLSRSLFAYTKLYIIVVQNDNQWTKQNLILNRYYYEHYWYIYIHHLQRLTDFTHLLQEFYYKLVSYWKEWESSDVCNRFKQGKCFCMPICVSRVLINSCIIYLYRVLIQQLINWGCIKRRITKLSVL